LISTKRAVDQEITKELLI